MPQIAEGPGAGPDNAQAAASPAPAARQRNTNSTGSPSRNERQGSDSSTTSPLHPRPARTPEPSSRPVAIRAACTGRQIRRQPPPHQRSRPSASRSISSTMTPSHLHSHHGPGSSCHAGQPSREADEPPGYSHRSPAAEATNSTNHHHTVRAARPGPRSCGISNIARQNRHSYDRSLYSLDDPSRQVSGAGPGIDSDVPFCG